MLPDADLSIVCPATYQPVAGLTSRYRLVTSQRPWITAELDCEGDGGHLIVISNAAEDAWASAQGEGWLGTTDHVEEGTFVHITGEPVTFTNWQASEPSNSNNVEDCVHHRDDLQWNDSTCANFEEFICECDGLAPKTPATWCDTTTNANCGECGTTCTGGDSCNSQVCSDPS